VRPVLVTGPEEEPITLAEAKTHLNVSGSHDDTYITGLVAAARRAVERYLNRVLITQEWKVYYSNWCNELAVPFGKLQSIETVKYYNTDGMLTTLNANTFYWVVTTSEPGKIVRKYDANFPELQYGRPDSIEIAFTCGFGDEATDVPDDIKHGIKLLIANYYEHRGDVVIGAVANKIPTHVSDLLHSYKLYEF
jgi:uncharacterized phiE125 gp8 family phage protein